MFTKTYSDASQFIINVLSGIEPHPSLAPLCDRYWLDFVTYRAYKKSRCGKKKMQLMYFEQEQRFILAKKIFGVRCTLIVL